jgi:uncharacterized SAM-binding protein YcdF (DUF218 family)
MKKEGIIYLIITILFILLSVIILSNTDLLNNIELSKSIEIIIILFLMRISYGCTLYIRKQYKKHKYSYNIILNLGLVIFLDLNIVRHIGHLISNWNFLNITEVYNNTLKSFSYFAILTLPCIAVLAVYAIITNIVLIKKEGFSYRNLLGVFLGIFALMGLFGSQTLYMLTSKLVSGEQLVIVKKFFDIMINVVLSYFYTLIIATLYCNTLAANHIPTFDKDYVIILGCKIKEDGTLTPILKARVDRAIEFAKMQKEKTGKDIFFIPSGGKGSDEVMSEANAMKNYLIKQGISKDNILVENKSTNTIENMKFSNSIIIKNKENAKISFSTTNYHVFRSGIIANECGIDCEGMGSPTKWYFYTNALIREFIANLMNQKKEHFILVTFINVVLFILVIIGYKYNLM